MMGPKWILVLGVALVASFAMADEIPFDTNVPESSAPSSGTGATAADLDQPTTSTPPPPAGVQPQKSDVKTELEGAAPSADIDVPEIKPSQPVLPRGPRDKKADEDLSGLGNLAPFNDIAVISKRFLPKTNRFEFFPNFGVVLNDAFFNDIIFGARLGYYFTENWGVEAVGMGIGTSNKSVTNELVSQRNVGTQSLVSPQSYYGLDAKWDPIYGKLGFMDKKIISFDTYFVVGGGVTGTNQGSSPPTIHFGGGQLFAINKWSAFRWDVSFYAYNASSSVSNSSGTFSNLHATIGASFFFPGAEYR